MTWTALGLQLLGGSFYSSGSGNSRRFAEQINSVIKAQRGNKTVNGIAPTVGSETNITISGNHLAIAAGDVLIDGVRLAFAGGNVDLEGAHTPLLSGEARYVLITIFNNASTATLRATNGSVATDGSQEPPETPEDEVDVCIIYMTEADAVMSSDQIGDWRFPTPNGALIGDDEKQYLGDDGDSHTSWVSASSYFDINVSGSVAQFYADKIIIPNDISMDFGTSSPFMLEYDSGNAWLQLGDGTNDFLRVVDDGTSATFTFFSNIIVSGGDISVLDDNSIVLGSGGSGTDADLLWVSASNRLDFQVGGTTRFQMTATAITSILNHDFSAGIDVTGSITVSSNIDMGGVGSRINQGNAIAISEVGYRQQLDFTDTDASIYGIRQTNVLNGGGPTNVNYYGYRSQVTINNAAQTLTATYGAYFDNPTITSGTIANVYGAYIEEATGGGSNNFDLFLAGDNAEKKTTSTWAVTSDERIKTAPKDYTKGLNELMQIKVRTFNYNGKYGFNPTKYDSVGIIANEMLKIKNLKNTVRSSDLYIDGEIINNFLKFDAHELTFLNISSTQQLKREKDELEKRVKAIEDLLI